VGIDLHNKVVGNITKRWATNFISKRWAWNFITKRWATSFKSERRTRNFIKKVGNKLHI
jgi:hypothetical protein